MRVHVEQLNPLLTKSPGGQGAVEKEGGQGFPSLGGQGPVAVPGLPAG